MDKKPGGEPGGVSWSECVPPCPAIGSQVVTACSGVIQYNATTPCIMLDGQNVFFCLPTCKSDFEADPNHSCAAGLVARSYRK